jgi:hypothetical protein
VAAAEATPSVLHRALYLVLAMDAPEVVLSAIDDGQAAWLRTSTDPGRSADPDRDAMRRWVTGRPGTVRR